MGMFVFVVAFVCLFVFFAFSRSFFFVSLSTIFSIGKEISPFLEYFFPEKLFHFKYVPLHKPFFSLFIINRKINNKESEPNLKLEQNLLIL